MATRNNKKFFLVALLGALSLGLTACDDEIASYPKDGDILPPSQGQSIYHNELSDIYESIRDGSLASDVLDKLLYEYANTIFGRYTAKAPSYSTNESNEQTLKAIVEGNDKAAQEAFVKAHKAYWPGATIPENPTEAELATAVAKLKAIYKSVEDRIAKALYAKISSGSYSEHNLFSERKLLASLYFDGKKVAKYDEVPAGQLSEDLLISPEIEEEEVFEKGVLHKDHYYSDTNTYAIDENIETIYRELLIEQYITDQSYSTLGRSYARKVNVLSLTIDSDNKADVPALVNYLVENVIAKKDGLNAYAPAAGEENRNLEQTGKNLFAMVSKIMKGLPKDLSEKVLNEAGDALVDNPNVDANAKEIVDALYNDGKTGLFGNTKDWEDLAKYDNNFLTSTAYGSMMKDYLKIKEDLVTTDSSIESSFTGSGSYTIAQGKEYKEREIELKSYTTKGWHLKNGGLSSLPETIRSRLFNLSVASALDSNALVDRTEDEWDYDTELVKNKYVAKVNGAYWLKAETVEDKNSNKDLYFYDSSSSTYYFVQIVEAVNPAKLSVDGSGRYAVVYKEGEVNNELLQETIAREVCEQVATLSSYSGLAKDHWLKEMSLAYHDDKIYDYFKDNYPDLFD